MLNIGVLFLFFTLLYNEEELLFSLSKNVNFLQGKVTLEIPYLETCLSRFHSLYPKRTFPNQYEIGKES